MPSDNGDNKDNKESLPNLPVKNEENDDEEFKGFDELTRRLPTNELERDVNDIGLDIQFLEAQIESDLGSYSPDHLQDANAKILLFEEKGRPNEN